MMMTTGFSERQTNTIYDVTPNPNILKEFQIRKKYRMSDTDS